MKRIIGSILFLAVFMVLFSPLSVSSQERDFPNRPINIFVGYAPGGSATHSGNIMCEGLKKHFGQPVMLNFKTGAAQTVAGEYVANSKPDGYNLYWVNKSDLIAKVAKDESILKFHLNDVESVGGGPYTPCALAVKNDSPWQKIEDLISAAQKSPGKLKYASSGTGAVSHLSLLILSMKTGISLKHIPYSGGGPAVSALLGGHVEMSVMTLSTFGAHVKPGGGLRALVVFDPKRSSELPAVPTALERGIDIQSLSGWYSLEAPKGLPKGVKDALAKGVEKTLKDKAIVSLMAKVGFDTEYLDPASVEKKTQDEYKLMKEVCKRAGLIK